MPGKSAGAVTKPLGAAHLPLKFCQRNCFRASGLKYEDNTNSACHLTFPPGNRCLGAFGLVSNRMACIVPDNGVDQLRPLLLTKILMSAFERRQGKVE